MRQSMAAGRVPASVRRMALTSLGAGLAVAAAAPMASAATVAGTMPAAAQAQEQTQGTRLAAPEAAIAPDWSRLGQLKLYPLAGTGVDPLSNVVGTSLGGIPVSTRPVADAFADGLPVFDLPLVGGLLGGLHG